MRRVVLLALVTFACGGGPAAVVTPPPLHVTAKPPAPPRARWVFSAPETEIRAKLELGEHRTLYVGEHGRRELDDGGKVEHAPTLAEEALGGVLRDDKGRFVFVAVDGDTYVATDPLGPLERVKPPRREALASVTTGRAAILAISGGALVRSTDWGATWKPVDYAAGSKPFGEAHAVALDSKGNGVLVHLPQRLYVTHDDGATWKPIASPKWGASKTFRDGADRVFVAGYHDAYATLGRDALAETTDAPAPIFPGQQLVRPRSFDYEERSAYRRRPPVLHFAPPEPLRLLAGDHVVQIDVHDGKPTVASAPLGEPLASPATPSELDVHAADARRVAAYGGELAYARADVADDDTDTKEAKPPTTTILRSDDYGATWKKGDVLQGVPRENARAIALGPRGWLYVGPLCATPASAQCDPSRIRGAGKTAFEETGDVDLGLGAFVFDEAHDKVYALADASGGSVLYEGALDGGKLARTSLLLQAPAERVAMTVDARGDLRIFERTGRTTILHERSAKGDELPARYLDLGLVTLAFAGERGLAIADHASYETRDAGETWTRVPSNGSTYGVTCGAAGCLLAGAERVGWDLPAVEAGDVVRASATAPIDEPRPKPPEPAVTKVLLACTIAGKGGAVEEFGESWVDGTAAVKWARTWMNYGTGALTISYADDKALHAVTLLGAPGASATQVRTGFRASDDGVVGARYRFQSRSRTGKLNPVQVELAWWSPAKPRVRRGTIQAVKPFRVSRFGFTGRANVVDGGVLFQGGSGDVLHFVRDDGGQETLAAPPIVFDEAWHSGKRWLLLDADDEVFEMAVSDDGGKTWSLRGWGFGPTRSYGDAKLETAGGKLVMRAGPALFEVGWPVGSDPPSGTPLAERADAPCDGLAIGTTTHQDHMRGASPVTMELGGATYASGDRVLHDSSSGKLCTSAYVLEQGRDNGAYLFRGPAGAWSGWAFRSKDDKTIAEPFRCR